MDLDEPSVSDEDMARFHIVAHARAWIESGQPVELRMPTLKSFTRMREQRDRSEPLRGRLRGIEVEVSSGTVLETALGLTDDSPLDVLGARVACFINQETIRESAEALAMLLSAAIFQLQEDGALTEGEAIPPPLLLQAAMVILHEFLDLENCFYLSHFMRFAIAQDFLNFEEEEQLQYFAKMLAGAYAIIHGPLPAQELTSEADEGDEPEAEELELRMGEVVPDRDESGMTQDDAYHMVRLVMIVDQRLFLRAATSAGTQTPKVIARPSTANVTRMPLSPPARAAQIERANEIMSRVEEARLVGIGRDATVQLAEILERVMGAERAKRFCEMSFWAFHDEGDTANADTWEVMRTFIDMEFLCQLGKPFRLEHFRRNIEIISDQDGGRVVFDGGATMSFEGMRTLFRPSLGSAV